MSKIDTAPLEIASNSTSTALWNPLTGPVNSALMRNARVRVRFEGADFLAGHSAPRHGRARGRAAHGTALNRAELPSTTQSRRSHGGCTEKICVQADLRARSVELRASVVGGRCCLAGDGPGSACAAALRRPPTEELNLGAGRSDRRSPVPDESGGRG